MKLNLWSFNAERGQGGNRQSVPPILSFASFLSKNWLEGIQKTNSLQSFKNETGIKIPFTPLYYMCSLQFIYKNWEEVFRLPLLQKKILLSFRSFTLSLFVVSWIEYQKIFPLSSIFYNIFLQKSTRKCGIFWVHR